MKTLDVLVFISLIPALPVLATWYLPWEDWIPKKVPKRIIGPYLLYCAFGAWYFKGSWWVIACAALFGAVVCAIAFLESKARQ
jgi:hypothetical protein